MENLKSEIKSILGQKVSDDDVEKLTELFNSRLKKKIPLKNSRSELEWMVTEDILYVEIPKNVVTFVSINGASFNQCSNGHDLGNLLKVDPNFIPVNRATYINLARATKYDSYKKIVYFNDDVITNNTPRVEGVTDDTIKTVLIKALGKHNDLNTNTEKGQYSPLKGTRLFSR